MRREREHPDGRSSTSGEALSPGGGAAEASARGRGSAINPASRFETISLAQLPAGGGDDDLIWCGVDEEEADGGAARAAKRVPTSVYRDKTRTVINAVDSPDLPFSWTINPYRGCEHGCVYCYARPTHEYLGMSSGLDFETKIYAKVDAVELLKRELSRPKWRGDPIAMSGITDSYQPIERRLRITRGCLEVMAARRQPVTIVTKSALVARDVDVLSRLAAVGAARVAVSLTTLDAELSASMEPRACAPARRLEAMRKLSEAGIPVMVMTAPIIPGLNDAEIPRLLEAAAAHGAVHAGYVLLRLPWQNKALFLDWLKRREPAKAARIEGLVRDARGGGLYRARFGERMRGEGAYARQIGQTVRIFAKRYGLDRPIPPLNSREFIRVPVEAAPDADHQLRLF